MAQSEQLNKIDTVLDNFKEGIWQKNHRIEPDGTMIHFMCNEGFRHNSQIKTELKILIDAVFDIVESDSKPLQK